MEKWEYEIISATAHYRRDAQIRLFRDMGKEGWEFVGQIGDEAPHSEVDLSWVFRRRKGVPDED